MSSWRSKESLRLRKKWPGMRCGKRKKSHRMEVKTSDSNDTKSKIGYPQLHFSKWNKEDWDLKGGRLTGGRQIDHAASPSWITWANMATLRVSQQRSLGKQALKLGWGVCCLQAGATGSEPVSVCHCQGIRTNSHFTPPLNMPPTFTSPWRSIKLRPKIAP